VEEDRGYDKRGQVRHEEEEVHTILAKEENIKQNRGKRLGHRRKIINGSGSRRNNDDQGRRKGKSEDDHKTICQGTSSKSSREAIRLAQRTNKVK
jgi:hypothetical protein